MADDYSISAKITADTSGFEKGVKKAQTASKNLSNSVSGVIKGLGKSGLVGALGAVGLATNGVTAVLGVAKKAFQEVSKTINECSEAYRKQYQAEIALETAIKNNPLVDGSATRGLKQFASEIQSVSNLGDEELLPMMADLIAKGRTEAETMNIIRVATDMSASGTISFENAIQQLNATLNGNIGRLGMQNAELKDLTAEELKNGKAVEILGNKYKGLAEATADTKKQLNNAIGDFKETIGQVFDNAFAPMRKYFTEVISNLNDSIKKSRELKGATKEVYSDDGGINLEASTESLQIMWSEVLHKQQEVTRNYAQYMQLYGKYINEATDETAQSYKTQIANLNSDLKTISDELNRRKTEAEKEKKEAQEAEENKRKQAELAELEKQQAEERKKQAELASEWEKKLYNQRIENLEKARERELSNEKLTQQERLEVCTYYGDMILSMRLNQVEKEREEALSQEGVTGETRETINRYYDGKITETRRTESEKREKIAKDEGEEEEKESKKTFSEILSIVKQYTKKIGETFKSVANTVKKVFTSVGSFIKNTFSAVANFSKNVFNTVKNIFTKLFKFNVSDALDSLLAVEDAILTFFVETLPKLPAFFESAFSSVLILIKTLINNIDWKKVKKILDSIIKTFTTYAPQILRGIVALFTGIVRTFSDSIITNLTDITSTITELAIIAVNGISEIITIISSLLIQSAPEIVKMFGEIFFAILEELPSILTNIINVLGTFITEIARYITDNAPRLTTDLNNVVKSIIDGVTNFLENGGWKTLLDAILAIQKVIEDVITDNLDDIVDLIVDALPDLIQFVIDSIVSASQTFAKLLKPIMKLILALVKGLVQILTSEEVMDAGMEALTQFIEVLFTDFLPEIVKMLPDLITKIITAMLKLIPKIVVALVEGLVNGFTKTDWVTVIKNAFTGFVDAIKNFFGIHSPSTLFEEFGKFMVQGLWNGINGLGSWIKTNVTSYFSGVWNNITGAFGNAQQWFSSLFTGIKDNVCSIFDKLVTALKTPINAIISMINRIIDGFNSLSISIPDWVPVVGGRNFGVSIPKIQQLARGTQNAYKGLTLVGEAGPELVRFRGGEQVLNNRNTQKALEGMGGTTVNQNITFNNLQDTTAFAMIQQMKQYNRQMAINGII